MKTKLLFIVMVFHAFNLSAAISSLSGNGTTTDPYLISSVEELKWMRDQVNDKDQADYARATYKLMADLDFTDENDWIPIGGKEIPFKGVFHGNDKTIKNIKIGSEDNPADIHSASLFGRTKNATIENLGVEWSGFYSYYEVDSDSYSGGIVGYMEGGSINNSHTTGDISSSGSFSYSGGIVGYMVEGNISNSYSTGDVSNSDSDSYSGGIVGYMATGSILNSYSSGDISTSQYYSNSYSGGIVGYMGSGSISNSHATGDISNSNSNSNSYSGGIAGYMGGGSISNSYATGNVYSSDCNFYSYSGGIVGYMHNGNISNSYSSGDISNSDSGGIAGYMNNGSILNSYSTGNISSSNSNSNAYSGGIVGSMGNGSILNSYSTGNISSSSSSPYSSSYSYSGGIVGYLRAGIISNNIALNSFIYAFNNKDTKSCFTGRIVGGTVPENANAKIESNYASSDVVLAIGISSEELTPVTDFSGDKNGEELNDEPVNVLNNYVAGKRYSDEGVLFCSWKVDKAVNQGNPTLDYSSPAIEFTLEGSGSETNPFLIYTNEDLIRVSVFANTYPSEYANKFYRLMSDLDFTGEKDWTPIGIKTPFKGIFDGNGKTIKNIRIGHEDNPTSPSAGLFGYIENATIENLGIEWDGLFSSDYSGGIAGCMNSGTIRNSYSSGIISGSISGGIAGNMSTGTISGSYSTATIFASKTYCGGIVGKMNGGNINNSYSTGNISASSSNRAFSGGIAGDMDTGDISNSYSTGNISASSSNTYLDSYSYSGGIVGNLSNGGICNSYSTGDISASNFGDTYNAYHSYYACSGGIVGYMSSQSGNESISNTYATGNISASNSDGTNSYSYSGGIVGHIVSGNISNSIALNRFIYAFNKQTDKCFVGKIAGSSDTKTENNYALNDIAVAIGISSDQLTPVTDFSGDKNGEELNNEPITVLNNYVTGKKYSDTGALLCSWTVEKDVNQGNPILDYSSPTMQFTLEGTGSETNPFLIYTNEDLIKVSVFVNTYPNEYSNKFYKLMADLDFTGENDWTPIGIYAPFKGVFNGNDKTIKNIKIGREDKYATIDSPGFFSWTENAIIENLGVEWSGLYSYSSYSGGIVGYMNNGSIRNSYSSGNIYSSSKSESYCGGIVGFMNIDSDSDNESIQNSYSSGNIYSSSESKSYCGGIVGFMNIDSDNGSIQNSYSSGNIYSSSKSESYCGGIVGYMENEYGSYNGSIQNSYSSGNIYSSSASSSFSGGIIGYMNSHKGSIRNSYSSGNISSSSESESYSGGIVGYINSYTGIISNSYSSGDISSSSESSKSYSGGIAGYMNSESGGIRNSYSSGDISSSSTSSRSYSGGIVSYMKEVNIYNSYSSGDISSSSPSKSYSGGIAGYMNSGDVTSCISLNPSITSICIESKDYAFAGRIGAYHKDMTLSSNYAAENVSVKTGTSESDLSAIDPVGENHGDNLNDTPLNLLNNWVTDNTTPETPYLTWCVLESVNNGNPVFAAFTILTVTFQTAEAMPEISTQATYGALLTKPIDPVCEGFDFAGWYKDPEYKQAWDFDADRVTDHITLYAKWDISDSIEELNSDHLVIYSGTGEIVVKSAASGITIYNTAGALIKTIQRPGSVEHIGVEAGYYILKTAGVSKKVIVY
ncbi:MAG: GLUG motif-containing protein [Bacteroidales bacterium]